MDICPICNEKLEVFVIDKIYNKCNNCKSLFKDVIREEKDRYIKEHIENTKRVMESDMIHYSNKLNKIVDFVKNKRIDKIIDFGGGIPKFPLKVVNSILVIDIFSDLWKELYKEIHEELNKYVNMNIKNVEYINGDVCNLDENIYKYIKKFIGGSKNIAITLFHVTEHMSVEDITKVLDTIKKIKKLNNETNIYTIIYGPNVDRFTYKEWLFNIDDHFTFIHLDTYKDIIFKKGFNVIKWGTIDEDLYIIFN